jgi:hypothetical protein
MFDEEANWSASSTIVSWSAKQTKVSALLKKEY